MNKEFLSKDNTKKLLTEVLKKNKLEALPKASKQIIVTDLITNMKNVFKSLDMNKINSNNLDLVLNQFNELCVEETSKNLSGSEVFKGEDSHVSRLKFSRDFHSTPQKEVKFLERPSSNSAPLGSNSVPLSNNSNQIRNQINKSSNSLDSLFQPISTNLNDSNFGYANTMNNSDPNIQSKMDQVSKLREMESNRRNQRPSTPDFLKSQKTQPDKPN